MKIPEFLSGKKINGNFILLQELTQSKFYEGHKDWVGRLSDNIVNISIEVYNLETQKSSIKTLHKSAKGLYFNGSIENGGFSARKKRFYMKDFRALLGGSGK